jgi:nucleotide-binding universal stress UspA family protein
MLKHILLPLDGSEVAERAIGYARQIIDPENGQITLLTALDVPEYPSVAFYPVAANYAEGRAELTEKLLPHAREYLCGQAEQLRTEGYRVAVETTIDDAARAIVEKAEQLGVDAIVMSTHGRSGFSRWLFGSVANKVLGSTECPVFIVPVRG